MWNVKSKEIHANFNILNIYKQMLFFVYLRYLSILLKDNLADEPIIFEKKSLRNSKIKVKMSDYD